MIRNGDTYAECKPCSVIKEQLNDVPRNKPAVVLTGDASLHLPDNAEHSAHIFTVLSVSKTEKTGEITKEIQQREHQQQRPATIPYSCMRTRVSVLQV